MSAKSLRRGRGQYDTLERILNKTTLTTQRISHDRIIEVGGHLLSSKTDDYKEEQKRELHDALAAMEARATRELKAALKRLTQEKYEEKTKALQNLKEYYEKREKRIEEQRDKAEEERMREVLKKFEKEKAAALATQREELECQKEIAVEEACKALSIRLHKEFLCEKEKAVMEALRIAEEKFKIREKEAMERVRRECEEVAKKEAERVAKLHEKHVEQLNQKYNVLEQKYMRELDHKKRVEQDFRELQDDYRRFMDYTDGKFHSDYLMRLRHLGRRLAEKQISEVTYEDIIKLPTDFR
ncbi:hypothetical protein CHS0354_034581 [Potamilus streckersoni]|uniref:Uncharacterized protein n=1 Tax=Potamilus streckersoni TaxID=2493646 RepID=A0AAE0SSP6_9BIVA|nr:hypothetical protein CHS0354_034581 [Potamilus streckersoni]